jgi:antitoxin HicB
MAVEAHRDPYAPAPPEIEAQARELVQRPYRKEIQWSVEDDAFIVWVPDLPGCIADGETEAEALREVEIVMQLWVESALMDGLPVPEPSPIQEYSGKLLVRMPKTLHRKLMEQAEYEGVSANQVAVALLAKGL